MSEKTGTYGKISRFYRRDCFHYKYASNQKDQIIHSCLSEWYYIKARKQQIQRHAPGNLHNFIRFSVLCKTSRPASSEKQPVFGQWWETMGKIGNWYLQIYRILARLNIVLPDFAHFGYNSTSLFANDGSLYIYIHKFCSAYRYVQPESSGRWFHRVTIYIFIWIFCRNFFIFLLVICSCFIVLLSLYACIAVSNTVVYPSDIYSCFILL